MQRVQVNFYLYAEDNDRAVLFYEQNFGFKPEGHITPGNKTEWTALRAENALVWLGPTGSKSGLIILVENNLPQLIDNLIQSGVTVFIPEELTDQQHGERPMIETHWGNHTWMLDCEGNVVMLFEPAEG